MALPQSAEEWIAAVNEILQLCRGGGGVGESERLSREEAIARLKELGVAEGDANRWLGC